jgi:hypothetical protein
MKPKPSASREIVEHADMLREFAGEEIANDWLRETFQEQEASIRRFEKAARAPSKRKKGAGKVKK